MVKMHNNGEKRKMDGILAEQQKMRNLKKAFFDMAGVLAPGGLRSHLSGKLSMQFARVGKTVQ
jgi:hypothetical protein